MRQACEGNSRGNRVFILLKQLLYTQRGREEPIFKVKQTVVAISLLLTSDVRRSEEERDPGREELEISTPRSIDLVDLSPLGELALVRCEDE